ERLRRLRSFGATVSDHVRHQAQGVVHEEYLEVGYNYRMTDLQAAIGIAQLAKLDGLLARRQHLARRYDEAFRARLDLQLPARPAYATHAFQSYAVRLRPECQADRDEVIRHLVNAGVSCRRGIAPVHLEPIFRDRLGPVRLPVTEDVSSRSLFLPIFGSL